MINVAQYESIDISAEVEFDTKEFEEAQDDPAAFANEQLNLLLEEEMEAASQVTSRRNSFIHEYRYTEEQED